MNLIVNFILLTLHLSFAQIALAELDFSKDVEWSAYKKEYKKFYANEIEEAQRYFVI
jgi:hypothetical protein